MSVKRLIYGIIATIAFAIPRFGFADSNWPGWRGPSQDGHSTEQGLPSKWNADSVTWKIPLKGWGQSSAVIWGDRIFLTTALERGRTRSVFCVDRNQGKILWEKVAWTGEPNGSHSLNGWASASCVTDGERVFAFFGKGGLHCFRVTGERLWSKDLGNFVCEKYWGHAASPVLAGDLVIQNCDADEDAFITGIDKKTGKTVWKTKRENFRGWSTPVLIKAAGRNELVVNGHASVRAYEPLTGKGLWHCKSFIGRGSPTVTPAHGLVHVLNGLRGDIYAIEPGGDGDVTKTRMAWHTPRKSRDISSPIVVGNYVLVIGLRGGIMTCYHTPSGKEIWKHRTGGNFTASPVSYDGLAFFLSETGATFVVKPGDSPNIVASNTLNRSDSENFRASITPSDGQAFIRSNEVLYCIGNRKSTKR